MERVDEDTGEIIGSHVMMTPSAGKLFESLAKAQAEIGDAERDGSNPHFGSTYATLKAVRAACGPALAKHGLCVLQPPVSTDGQHVTVVTILGHSSGQWVRSELTLRAKDTSPQSVVSCVTYGRRCSLAAVAGVAPEDDDGHAATGETSPQAPRRSQGQPRRQTGDDRGFPAKREGVCPACGGMIAEGERIKKSEALRGYVHVECPQADQPDAEPPPPDESDIPF